MADSVANAPMLRALPPEAQEELKNQLEQQAQPIREKAADHFAAAVAKSRELAIRSDCATKSLQVLRTTYRPAQYPPLLEELANPRQERGVQPPAPQLLTSVQPANPAVVLKGTAAGLPPGKPVVSRETPASDTSGRQDDASDLRPGQRPSDAARSPGVVPASATQPKKPAADAEPEDARQ
jgi:hypothetical protein